MKVLVVGGGRMGQRHIAGLLGEIAEIAVVDPMEQARAACAGLAAGVPFSAFPSLAQLPVGTKFDAVILAATAAGRLEQLQWAMGSGARAVLAEKPIEQSRARMRSFIQLAGSGGSQVWCNHYRRNLRGFDSLRASGGPFVISVSSGAMGLGCNGIHWIDFALYLTGQSKGTLLFGEVEEAVIGSGRGAQFRDYGGRGVFAFPDGSRLYLSCSATSSAPTMMSVVSGTSHWVVDQQSDRAFIHELPAGISHPTFLYGKDYAFREAAGLEAVDFTEQTRSFVRALVRGVEPSQPRLVEVAPAYELLFDLLESGGGEEFRFT